MGKNEKMYSLSDAEIQFVSLVDSAANKRQFLIAKAENGQADFVTSGRIIKKDSENHYVTGIVYEPDCEDTQNDSMTAEEIQKAAYWFMKNGDGVDLQHDFEKLENASVVESWVAKSDFNIDDETVLKGTWLMTVEVSDPDVWDDIEKGKITGFSMGGKAVRTEKAVKNNEKKGFWKSMFEKLNVKKGAVANDFNRTAKSTLFWRSFESLRKVLSRYDSALGEDVFEADEETIKEALADFNMIVQGILTEPDIASVISAAAPVEKAGKKISDKNMNTLKEIHEMLKTLIDSTQSKKKDDDETGVQKSDSDSGIDAEELLSRRISEAVAKAVEPLYQSRGIPTNLNNEHVQKSKDVFDGLFV